MIEVHDLDIRGSLDVQILGGVSVNLETGQTVAAVGGSGAGKTTLGLALLGFVRPGMRRVGGAVRFDGQDMFGLTDAELRRLRRESIAYLPQNPASTLTPTMRIEDLVEERRLAHSKPTEHLLELVHLPCDRTFRRRYPHQLSIGQQQRVAMARAIANEPRLLILDEPTSSIDPTTQRLMLALVERLRDEHGAATLLISHDLASVARMADEVVVLRHGEIVERGAALRVLHSPVDSYSKALVSASPDIAVDQPPLLEDTDEPVPVLKVRGLSAEFNLGRGRGRRTIRAARDVSFVLSAGETLALIGRSGSGKSTIARALVGLHPPEAGDVLLDGVSVPSLLRRRNRSKRAAIQLVPQNPEESFNPRRTVGDGILRSIRQTRGLSGSAATERLAQLLDQVQLDPALARRRPHELSGGEQQRAAIARALAAEPKVLICDEITTALDTIVQGQVVDLLQQIQRDTRISLLFITHDLALAHEFAHRVGVLSEGKLVEIASMAEFVRDPQSAESRELLGAAPSLSRTLVARQHAAAGVPAEAAS
ncbi:MAG: ABC transporter ATP-binding protein [Chloroflexi bacterium]|nr:ABC transporter ATP-binding protein [Chloroflexota bacterium]MYF81900.1 ABC transporter ATP-binding protein [Chloroflexota bacterium]MYI03555.1 ABC transporter ATP-binding protein [Chloroflexota bacterium]